MREVIGRDIWIVIGPVSAGFVAAVVAGVLYGRRRGKRRRAQENDKPVT